MMTPEIVGRYELLRPLGSGGMGEVFLATDTALRRRVAVKRVAAGDEGAAKYILHEARIVASLDHPNIARVYDVVEHHGLPHVVMEFVDGSTLSQLASGQRLSEDLAIHYGRQIAGALAYAHEHNVIHCDVKPGNVMITTGGAVKVLDFGIARQIESKRATTTGSIKGTPPYMAPEVLLGAPASKQSDVFGLGVLMYELLAGRRPYEGRGAAAVLSAMTTTAPRLHQSVAGVSRELSAVIARAIQTDAAARLPSAHAFKDELDRLAPASTETAAVMPRRAPRAKSVALLACFALACTALVAGVPRLTPHVLPAQRSVLGVMIFNSSGQAENEYLASGMADVLISQLASTANITVVPRTAMPSLTTPTQVVEAVNALGLTHVITGSVQRSGDTLRMAISLIGDRGRSLEWSETFDGPIKDVFHLEQRIGQAALQALRSEGLATNEAVAGARERAPTASPEAFEAYAHGRALIARADVPGNVDRAMAFFTRATELDPSFARAHAAIGDAHWRNYRSSRDPLFVDRARSALLDALRFAPDDAAVAYTLAVVDHGTGRSEDAIRTLEGVLAKHPANDDAHRLLGRIYSERGDFDRAIVELREAQAIRPEYPATVRDLGIAYFDKGRFNEAISAFTRLASLQPDNAAAYQLLGTAYHAANHLDRALGAYTQANNLNPRATTHSNIGTVHYARGEYAAAATAYRNAITLQPKEATTRRNLADALWQVGDREGARREYEAAIALAFEALKVNPAAIRSRSLVAYCSAKLGRLDEARRRITEIVREAPSDSDAAYKGAVIEAIAGNNEESLRLLQRALELGYSLALVLTDRDLDRVRQLPGFQRLLAP